MDISNNIINNHIYDNCGNKISNDKFKLKLNDIDINDNSGNTSYKLYLSNNVLDDISNNQIEEIEIDVISLQNEHNSFILDNKCDNIFIYGKEVDDLNILDKQNYLL